MTCHRCGEDMGLVDQVAEADELYYEGVSGPIVLMLTCPTCEDQTAILEIIPTDESEIIETADGEKVKIPVIKKNKKRYE